MYRPPRDPAPSSRALDGWYDVEVASVRIVGADGVQQALKPSGAILEELELGPMQQP
jgi:hypothetical protein